MPNLSDYDPAVKYGANLDVNVDLADIRDANNNELLEFDTVASAVNYIQIANAATGNRPILSATGEADLGFVFQNDQGEEILGLQAEATGVPYVEIANAASAANPTIAATAEADLGLTFLNDQGEEMLILDAVATGVNYVQIANSASGTAAVISAQGDDSNVELQLQGLGTANVLVGTHDTATEASNAVTINSQSGVITTASLTTGSAATYDIDMTNDHVHLGSKLFAFVSRADNSAGIPIVSGVSVGAGTAVLNVSNLGSTALDGTLEISFMVL